jgi:glutaredoxin
MLFIRELEKFPQININFQKICVDKNNVNYQKALQFINHYKIVGVPSIVINNNVYLGYDAFDWLKNNIEINTQSVYPSMNKRDYSDVVNTNQNTVLSGLNSEDSQMQPINYSNNHMNINGVSNKQVHQNNKNNDLPPELQPVICKKTNDDTMSELEMYQRQRTL